jgi:hypothetical protein
MDSTGPDNNLNSTEMENLDRLEAVAQRGLHTYAEVREALAEIRDAQLYRKTHRTFDAYLSERWGIDRPQPWRQHRDRLADLVGVRLFPRLRWLLAQSSGTIADAAHQLESHPFDVDDDAREQLRDDVLVIEEELAMLRALLDSIDWDAEFGRMLRGEISEPETDADFDDE